ncbi:hypothetical protein [Methyloversatilis sp. XJ19-49]|uniref:hypothetical protein n=1 Tax=Methyloversatilis sp. XJ19-49 TaxID=2963429 RepID=UPI00211C9C8C|nr:hypothetical protein [Methyloversatilis sp. XJ19-49]MCQ9378810.1 hypothetical protein [Methyloversatilis sp. XJ19-49]
MPIISTDIKYRLSGGASNTDPNASIGGIKSSTEIGTGLHNLFDVVGSAETTAGDTEYRCFYAHNGHGSLTLENAVVFIQSNTPSGDTSVEIGVGAAAVNGTETAVADESTAPAGVTFFAAANLGAALSLGNLPAGQHRAVWVKRIVGAGAAAYTDDQATIRIQGDTAA